MSQPTLTIQMCADHCARIERLARFYGHKDKDAFAASLLEYAIKETEMWMRSEKYARFECLIDAIEREIVRLNRKYPSEYSPDESDLDDGIPF